MDASEVVGKAKTECSHGKSEVVRLALRARSVGIPR